MTARRHLPDDDRSFPFEGGSDHYGALLAQLLGRIKRAADDDLAALWSEAGRCISELGACSVTIMVNSAGSWFDLRRLETPDLAIDHGATFKQPPVNEPDKIAGEQLLVIRPGAIVAKLKTAVIDTARTAALEALAHGIDMALALCDGRQRLARNVGELDVLRTVATRILEITDLDALFLLVSHETRTLLGSDICGVMLREGNEVVMRSCVGHFAAETARLRMEAGVGVAGQVLQSGELCMVPNYVESEIITHDFVPLARTEKVRSALAVPIISRNAIIGVLEVWRRQPSIFTANDCRLLQSLAGLTSIAIDNARLMASRAQAASELAAAHTTLAERYDTIVQAAEFQRATARLLLTNDPLPSVARKTADFTQGTIFILNRELGVDAAHGACSGDETVLSALARFLGSAHPLSEEPAAGVAEGRQVFALPVSTATEALGWIAWVGDKEPQEVARLSLGHVAVSTAMHLLERRRIARERTETLEGLLWDLLEGTEPVRAAAIDRARELRVPIRGRMRVVLVMLEGLQGQQSDESRHGQVHDDIVNRIRLSEIGRAAHIVGVRGGQARLLVRDGDMAGLTASLTALLNQLRKLFPFLSLSAGVSGVCDNLQLLPSSLREALVGAEVARHRTNDTVAFYEDAGILGLMIDLRDKVDMRRISDQILGGVVRENDQTRQTLLSTLAAYFVADCSQTEAALRLNVHQKTIAYRLAKISVLSGLDLSRHQDRLLLDVATKLRLMLQD